MSLEAAEESREGGKGQEKGDRIGGVNRAFSRLDGQQRSTVWSCAGGREGINFIVVQILMLADRTRRADVRRCDKDENEDINAPIGKQLSSLWRCIGPEEMIFGVAVSEPVTPQEPSKIRNQEGS
jgi:hypothetical protein